MLIYFLCLLLGETSAIASSAHGKDEVKTADMRRRVRDLTQCRQIMVAERKEWLERRQAAWAHEDHHAVVPLDAAVPLDQKIKKQPVEKNSILDSKKIRLKMPKPIKKMLKESGLSAQDIQEGYIDPFTNQELKVSLDVARKAGLPFILALELSHAKNNTEQKIARFYEVNDTVRKWHALRSPKPKSSPVHEDIIDDILYFYFNPQKSGKDEFVFMGNHRDFTAPEGPRPDGPRPA